jgi:hypothetical protein
MLLTTAIEAVASQKIKEVTMDHLVYLESAKELKALISGEKTMIARASMGKKRPYGKVESGDTLFFLAGFNPKVKAMAKVKKGSSAEMEDKLTVSIRKHYSKILSPEPQVTLFEKRYLVLVEMEKAHHIVPFALSEGVHGSPGDWLVVENIDEAIG